MTTCWVLTDDYTGLPLQPAPDGFWETLREPLGLSDRDLPSCFMRLPGTCQDCHLGPLHGAGTRCIYCHELAGFRIRPDAPAARQLRSLRLDGQLLVILGVLLAVIGAAHGELTLAALGGYIAVIGTAVTLILREPR